APGGTTFGALSESLDALTLFAGEPKMAASLEYRRWAVENAALDLALQQAGVSPGQAGGGGRAAGGLGGPARGGAFARLAAAPGLELKLDPAHEWTREFMERLAATGRVQVLDLKGYYHGTVVDVEPDPALYRNVVELFPEVVIEDASLEGEFGE